MAIRIISQPLLRTVDACLPCRYKPARPPARPTTTQPACLLHEATALHTSMDTITTIELPNSLAFYYHYYYYYIIVISCSTIIFVSPSLSLGSPLTRSLVSISVLFSRHDCYQHHLNIFNSFMHCIIVVVVG